MNGRDGAAAARQTAAATDRVWALKLPWTKPPLSLNDRMPRQQRDRVVSQVRNAAGWKAKAAQLGSHDRVRVTLYYRPPDKRTRDEDNLVATLKPLCDGLVDAGLVPDDTPAHMVKSMPVIEESTGSPGAMWLIIHVLDPTAPPVDWRKIAVKIGQRCDWSGLSNKEAAALREAIEVAEYCAENARLERTADAADQGEC